MKPKPKSPNLQRQGGFTLVELLVVMSVMVILATLVIVNFSAQRDPRNLKLAQSQLVTNIRKIQSYSLSGRVLPGGQSVQFYLLKIDLTKPSQYTIEAIYNADTGGSPKLQDVSTVYLPSRIIFASATPSINPLVITRSSLPYSQIPSSCGLISFAAPFGKVSFNSGCYIQNYPNIDTTNSSDAYNKILEFSSIPVNTDCTGSGSDPQTPPLCTISGDSSLTVTLTNVGGSISKTVTVDGINGLVTFN